MFNTLHSRLFVSYFLVAFVCLSVIGCVLLAMVGPLQRQLSYARLLDRAAPTALWVRGLLARNVSPADIVQRAEVQLDQQQERLLLITRDGHVLADSDEQLTGQTVRHFDFRDSEPVQWPARGQFLSATGQRHYFIVLPAATLRAVTDDTVLIVLVSQNTTRVLLEVTPFLLGAGIIGFVISLLLAFVISRWISWPLQRIAQAAEEMAEGNYSQTVEITSPDEARRLAESFNEMVRQVKAAQESQRDFVANVSHELKTPLTSIQGFAQAILDGTARDAGTRQQAAQIIQSEAERMTRLVEDLLVLAKITADRDRSSWTELDVSALVAACMQRLAVLAEAKHIAMRAEMTAVPHVHGNPDRLAQVFTNLLDNAIKHSPGEGEIVVTTRVLADTASRHRKRWVEISIADCGSCIPAESLSRIFERFYQVDKSRAAHKGGAGLGLAIVHEIIAAHDGQIHAENRVPRGALFVVRLPEA